MANKLNVKQKNLPLVFFRRMQMLRDEKTIVKLSKIVSNSKLYSDLVYRHFIKSMRITKN